MKDTSPLSNLKDIIKNINPVILDGEYVYVSFEFDLIQKKDCHKIFSIINEKEGVCAIIEKEYADRVNAKYDAVFSIITLQVYSSLNSVGLTEYVSSICHELNVPCNVIAGLHHDHILVPTNKAQDVVLKLSSE